MSAEHVNHDEQQKHHEHHQHGDHGHHKHEPKLVEVVIDGQKKEIPGGHYEVVKLKAVLGVPADYELDKVVGREFKELPDGDTVEVVKGGYPGIRYAMLHTLSHLLIRELALECGYNAASIRERIYADTSGKSPQAGILIYTAAADSDGTLGGLVDLGKPENLGRLVTQALDRSRICSSDPLCSEHDPEKDRSLHGAACHACSLVAETSCERGNRYLDRSLLVPTLDRADAAFFNGL